MTLKTTALLTHSTIILCSSVLLSACMTTQPIAASERPKQWAHPILTQSNFYQISPKLFRSERPDQALIPELQKHQIDVVINLRHRNQDANTFKASSFKLVHIPIQTWNINRQDLLMVMQQIQKAHRQNQNVLIHCYHGSDRTGASVTMYRIIFEDWSTTDALNEMKHGGYGFHPIWKNIEGLFSPENIKWIREQLSNPSVDVQQ